MQQSEENVARKAPTQKPKSLAKIYTQHKYYLGPKYPKYKKEGFCLPLSLHIIFVMLFSRNLHPI